MLIRSNRRQGHRCRPRRVLFLGTADHRRMRLTALWFCHAGTMASDVKPNFAAALLVARRAVPLPAHAGSCPGALAPRFRASIIARCCLLRFLSCLFLGRSSSVRTRVRSRVRGRGLGFNGEVGRRARALPLALMIYLSNGSAEAFHFVVAHPHNAASTRRVIAAPTQIACIVASAPNYFRTLRCFC